MNVEIRYGLDCKLVRGNAGGYAHTFGGDFPYAGTDPEGCPGAVHLLYRLDLTDPALPFRVHGNFRFLPLFFAFSSDGGPTMSYRVLSDSEIEIFGFDDDEHVGDAVYPGFPQLPAPVPIGVVPITYEELRDLAMFWYVHLHPWIDIPQEELQRFRNLGYPVARIGLTQDLVQLPRGGPCPNPACENSWLHTIATIPQWPFPDVDLWQADADIQIVYEICELCGSIRTYQICD